MSFVERAKALDHAKRGYLNKRREFLDHCLPELIAVVEAAEEHEEEHRIDTCLYAREHCPVLKALAALDQKADSGREE